MEPHWLHRLWEKLKNIARHPWHSLVSLLALVGGFIVSIPHFLLEALRWFWRVLGRIADISLWGLVRGLIYAFLGVCILVFALGFFLRSEEHTSELQSLRHLV